jgi:hypothetical protein
MLPYQIVMIVGVPRSGTTFLQIALSSHPEITTARETHLFDGYLGPILDRYQSEAELTGSSDGIHHLLSQEALIDHCRSIALAVFSALHQKSPNSRVLLEKTPGHIARLPMIRSCLPEAKFIHIIRDPRGVAASMKAARRETWGFWVPRDTDQAAQLWLRHIRDTRDVASHVLGDAYREVRYEDLFVRGGTILNDLYSWLNLPVCSTFRSNLSEQFPISRIAIAEGNEHDPRVETRPNFFRRGSPDAWRTELSSTEIDAVEAICGQFMDQLGYASLAKSADAQKVDASNQALPLRIDAASGSLDGTGFHQLETDHDGNPFRWTRSEARFYFIIDRSVPVKFSAQFGGMASKKGAASIRCFDDGVRIETAVKADADSFQLSGLLPSRSRAGGTTLTFLFPPASPAEHGLPDTRVLGSAFYWLDIDKAP